MQVNFSGLDKLVKVMDEVGPGVMTMRRKGIIKFFNQSKGYGFVTPEDGGKDVFVHITAVQKGGIPELIEGTKISFDVLDDSKGRGPQAIDLQLL